MTVTPPNPPGAVVAACDRLGDELPAKLEGHHSRVVEPRSPLTHAWGSPPIRMRCGVPTPPRYTPGSAETTIVNAVEWFQSTSGQVVVWTAIRHEANVELDVPMSYEAQGAYLVDLATPLTTALP